MFTKLPKTLKEKKHTVDKKIAKKFFKTCKKDEFFFDFQEIAKIVSIF